jgi:YegS/Rv2252/BmrU family lipid kinase
MAARLIVNPAAGGGKAKAMLGTIQPFLSREDDVEVVLTQGPGHATELARAVKSQENFTVISLGGDGTHHEVVNGLMPDPHCTFAVIPAGTGNDFVRLLRYPKSPEEILAVALRGNTMWLDVGQANEAYFLTVSGVGFDAEVAGWVNQHGKLGNGTGVFVRGILRQLIRYHSANMTVWVEGVSRSEPTFLLAAGNTPYYAGGMLMCPGAVADDGLFQIIWVRDLPRLSVLPLLARVFRGTHIQSPAVQTFDTGKLSIEGPSHMLVHADGEIVGHLPVTIRIVPKAIRVRTGIRG